MVNKSTIRSYIEKCQRAELLQKNWNPQSGDEFVYINLIDKHCDFGVYIFYDGTHFVKFLDGKFLKLDKIPKAIIWLPNIDRIIELCKKFSFYYNEFRLLNHMKIHLPKFYCTCYLKNLLIKEMWLLYYMIYKYNLKWYEASKQWKTIKLK